MLIEKMMKIKVLKYTFFFLILVLLGSSSPSGNIAGELNKDEVLIKLVMQNLTARHYSTTKIDDVFSKNAYKTYLSQLDFGKRFLTQDDISKLSKYELQLDNEINNGTYEFFNLSNELIKNRIAQVESFYEELLDEPIDFSVNESIETDSEKVKYPKDEKELRESWRKYIKYMAMNRVANALEMQERSSANPDVKEKVKTVQELEQEARKGLKRDLKDYFERLNEMENTERLSTYINAITAVYDPHTNYYAPRAKEKFDEDFSGRFEGIGAQLQQRDGEIKVVEIIPGSASWRQGQLKTGDIILKVAQGEEEPVDVSHMRLDNAVKLIRGRKGTEVRITVRKLDGSIATIPIIRDVVEKEETYAKSVVITEKDGSRVGYIFLPGFYADFGNSGGRNSGDDVKKELIKLKAEKVDGIVLDLRNNGGGSLADVIKMVGLFIEEGPVVQVRSRMGSPMVHNDDDPGITYDGPLVVMVNSLSASASEIMAAAIQDYKRGVIIGGATTFGKGTVQTIVDLDRFLPASYNDIKPLGSLMLTIQKFYRINGGTNQLKGVIPDIVLPDTYSSLRIGEREEKYPLPWDEIQPLKYKAWKHMEPKIAKARTNSKDRVSKNQVFSLINDNAERLKKQREKTQVTLNLEKYRSELKKEREDAKKYEAVNKFESQLIVSNLKTDMAEINLDSTRIRKNQNWHESIKKDIYLSEAVQVIKDLM